MHQPVYHGRRHLLIIENVYSLAELKIRSNDHAPLLIAVRDDLEQKLGPVPIQGDIAPFITD